MDENTPETKSHDVRLMQAGMAVCDALDELNYLGKVSGTRGLSCAFTQLEQGHILLQHELYSRGLHSIYSFSPGRNLYAESKVILPRPEDKRSDEHKEMDNSIARKGQVDLSPDQMLRIFTSPQFASEMGYRVVHNKDHGVWAVSLKG